MVKRIKAPLRKRQQQDVKTVSDLMGSIATDYILAGLSGLGSAKETATYAKALVIIAVAAHQSGLEQVADDLLELASKTAGKAKR